MMAVLFAIKGNLGPDPSAGLGPDSVHRPHRNPEHYQYSLYQYPYPDHGERHTAGHGYERGKPVPGIFVGRVLLWHQCGGDWVYHRIYRHSICGGRGSGCPAADGSSRGSHGLRITFCHRSLYPGNLYSTPEDQQDEHCGFH